MDAKSSVYPRTIDTDEYTMRNRRPLWVLVSAVHTNLVLVNLLQLGKGLQSYQTLHVSMINAFWSKGSISFLSISFVDQRKNLDNRKLGIV